MSAVDLYTKTIYQKYKYLANWLPNSSISLGDVGYIEENRFKKEKSLDDLGIKFKTIQGKSIIDDLSFHYQVQTNFELNGNTTTIPGELNSLAVGNAKIIFENEGSFTFDALDCKITSIENKGEVAEAIKDLYKKNKDYWKKDWYLIHEIVTAKSASIIVALSKNSEIELGFNTKLPGFNLANAKASIEIKAQNGDIMKIIAGKFVTPLFNVSKLKNTFLGGLIRSTQSLRFGGEVKEPISFNKIIGLEHPFWEMYEPAK